MSPLYHYRCRIARVIDGDTVETVIDVGFHLTATHRVRLLGVDAPELFRGTVEQRAAGQAAKAWVQEWVAEHTAPGWVWPFEIWTEKADSFGRYLGDIHAVDGSHLNAEIIEAGHGVAA